MAATGTPTPNIGLRIPVGTDPASVDDINYNSNLLDTVLGAVGNTSVKDQIDELSDQIAMKSTSVNNCLIHKILKFVSLSFYNFNIGTDGKTLTQVIPDGYRPYIKYMCVGRCYNGSSWVNMRFIIDTDGVITITDDSNNAISGIQQLYIMPRTFIYEST